MYAALTGLDTVVKNLKRSIVRKKSFAQFTLCMTIALGMAACGGGGDEDTDPTNTTDLAASLANAFNDALNGNGSTTSDAVVTISGSVGDGPIVEASIVIKDATERVVATTVSDENAKFSVDVPSTSEFPLVLIANGGTDLVTNDVPDFTLESVAINASTTKVNLNPFSTLAVKAARRMPGGLIAANVSVAEQDLMSQFGFGLNGSIVPSPITTPMTDARIAHIVKASEAFGETVRRTRNALLQLGENVDGNDVMDKLAADLSDGSIDGMGPNADLTTTNTVYAASAQVMMELLTNQLRVNGAEAGTLMDISIEIVQPTATVLTHDVPNTTAAFQQTRHAISVTQNLIPSTGLAAIASVFDAVNGAVTAEELMAVLPSNADVVMENAVVSVVTVQGGGSGSLPIDDSIRINAGGDLYIDSLGRVWAADTGFNTGAMASTSTAIDATVEDTLYQTERYNPAGNPELQYSFAVNNGDYIVNLYFAEISGVVLRTFNVEMEGQTFLSGLNIDAEVGRYTALVKSNLVTVSDGALDISFLRGVQNPKIAAIEIIKKEASDTSTVLSKPVSAYTNTATTIDVLGGSGAQNGDQQIVSILTGPSNGSVHVDGTQSIVYVPDSTDQTTDTIVYQVTGADGNITVASLDISVDCLSTCKADETLNLSWRKNPEPIVGYLVFVGPSAGAKMDFFKELRIDSGDFNPEAPAIDVAVAKELKLTTGESVCFRVKAYDGTEVSPESQAVCAVI